MHKFLCVRVQQTPERAGQSEAVYEVVSLQREAERSNEGRGRLASPTEEEEADEGRNVSCVFFFFFLHFIITAAFLWCSLKLVTYCMLCANCAKAPCPPESADSFLLVFLCLTDKMQKHFTGMPVQNMHIHPHTDTRVWSTTRRAHIHLFSPKSCLIETWPQIIALLKSLAAFNIWGKTRKTLSWPHSHFSERHICVIKITS